MKSSDALRRPVVLWSSQNVGTNQTILLLLLASPGWKRIRGLNFVKLNVHEILVVESCVKKDRYTVNK